MTQHDRRRWIAARLLSGVALGALALGCGSPQDSAPTDPCRNQAPGTACTWLGVGFEGHNGDGHLRYRTEVNQVQDLLFLPDGTAWFTDFNNYQVRRVLPDDTVQTMVGNTDPILPGDGPAGGSTAQGAAGLDWALNHPTNIVLGLDGSILLVAWHNHKLVTIDADTGWVKVVCGSGAGFRGDGGPASLALFKQPNDATIDEDGNLYVVDQQNQRIRKIDTEDQIDTIAGTGAYGFGGDGGPALEAEFAWEFGSNPNPSGGIAYHDQTLYVADTDNHRVRVIDLGTGIVDTLVGTGEPGYSGDGGPATEAMLASPHDLEVGPDGDLYIADTNNSVVRAVDLETGLIRTVVGTGELGIDDEEQLPATETRLRRPFGVAFDPDGDLYVMDSLNSRIVKVAR